MAILVSGSIAYDYIMDFGGVFTDHILPDQIHKLNISFVIEKLERYYGGVATNIAYSLNLLETEAVILGVSGKDFSSYASHLDEQKYVDSSHIISLVDDTTAAAYINTDRNSNQITAFYPGVLDRAYKFPKSIDLDNIKLALVGPENKESMLNNIIMLASEGVEIIFDSGQMTPYFTEKEWRHILGSVQGLVVNDYEFELVVRNSGLTRSKIHNLLQTVIITRGKAGSTITNKGRSYEIGAVSPIAVVDPTGAGDAYRAGLLAGIIRDLDWITAGQMAALAAVYAIEVRGTQKHSYSLSEFKLRYRDSFGIDFPL